MDRITSRRRRWHRSARALTAAATLGVALGLGALSSPAGATGQPTHFVWTAAAPTLQGDQTIIDNTATNGHQGALLFVSPN